MTENVAFINVTRQCNVDCQRCYLTPEHRAGKERLSIETLTAFLDNPFWAQDSLLIWEGGEPVAAGATVVRELVHAARAIQPLARQTMVTNCFSVPTWLIDLAHQEFDSRLETTFALGLKSNLTGNELAYREAFTKGLNRFWDSGITCPVNIELNRETIDLGVDALAGYILSTRAKVWEFDISIDFQTFLSRPEYTDRSTPILPPTVPYQVAWDYLDELHDKWGERFKDSGVTIGAFEQAPGERNNQFNVLSEHRFLTLNPDGVVTTNPLYSDLVGTFLGDLSRGDSLDAILASPRRLGRIVEERRRVLACSGCEHLSYCSGGPGHVPVHDGSGECAGGKRMWSKLVNEGSCFA